jgi:Mn2+/Fe2+ NRAMP family transporter
VPSASTTRTRSRLCTVLYSTVLYSVVKGMEKKSSKLLGFVVVCLVLVLCVCVCVCVCVCGNSCTCHWSF